MSPEIRRNGELVANIPDETGLYQAIDGSPLWLDTSGIEAENRRQVLIIEGLAVGGQRVLGLTQEGIGRSDDPKRGDRKEPSLEVKLNDRPIRVSYQDLRLVHRTRTLGGRNDSYYDSSKRTYHNPRWQKDRGGR